MAFRLPDQLPPRAQQHHHHHYEHQQHQQHQQQQPQQQQRVQSHSDSQLSPLAVSSPALAHQHDDADSTEWIIFSPTQQYSPASGTARRDHTASTGRTPRLSDFESLGSVHAAAEDGDEEDDDEDLLPECGEEEEEEEEEEQNELDSLDDGLRAFREPCGYGGAGGLPDAAAQLHQSDPAMLPAHDGLGTFPASSMNVQQQLWQHERLNPHRRGETTLHRRRRPSSVQRHLDSIVAESQPRDSDYDRWQRIEQWRMDQSRAFLQEVEKETRHKRRTSRISSGAGERSRAVPRLSTSEVMGDVSVESADNDRGASKEGKEDTLTGPGVVAPGSGEKNPAPQHVEESFWRRITRKVIKDLIGLDDSLLSVIMGESLMPIAEEEDGKAEASTEPQTEAHHHAKKRKASTILEPDLPEEMDEMLKTIAAPHQGDDAWWQEKLLQRLARELGTLVHQIREDPGAFTTYRRSSSLLLQTTDQHSDTRTPRPDPTAPTSLSSQPNHSSKAPSHSGSRNMSMRSPNFTPTLQDATTTNNNNNKTTARHTEAEGVAEKQYPAGNHPQPVPSSATSEVAIFPETTTTERDKQYWERELDVGLVFQYLHKRLFTDTDPFTRNSSSQRRVNSPSHRAAIIRQHHPLVGSAQNVATHSQRSLQFQAFTSSTAAATSPAGVGSTASPLLYRRMRRRSSSSCASQSTRKTLASGSSRNYWDIGGSVGSGSAVVAAVGGAGGGIGSWGDT